MPRTPLESKETGSASRSNLFIVSTSTDKADAETRKMIRSHVMRGKNKGKSMPRSSRARLASTGISPRSDSVGAGDQGVAQERIWADGAWSLWAPRKVASELSLFRYTSELNPSMRQLLFRAFTIVKPALYTVQLFGKDDRSNGIFCFNDLAEHPALVPSLLFTAQAFYDLGNGSSVGSFAHSHLAKALDLLRQSLKDKELSTSYTTMVVVSSLASAAVIVGDIETASKHMDGLNQLLQVRGGMKSLPPGSMIEYKARTLDFGLAMATGSKPRFAHDDISWSPQVAQGRSAAIFPELEAVQPRPDPRLLHVWADLRAFSALANGAEESNKAMQPGLFHKLNTTVVSRLTRLEYDQGSFSEVLRLVMLAYMKTLVIRLKGFGKGMKYIAEQLEANLGSLTLMSAENSPLIFWILLTIAISVFESLEPCWLRSGLERAVATLGLKHWPEAKSILKKFMWINGLHDLPGELLFLELFKDVTEETEEGSKRTYPPFLLSA